MAMPGGTIKARMVNSETTDSKGKGRLGKGENSAGSPVRHRKILVLFHSNSKDFPPGGGERDR